MAAQQRPLPRAGGKGSVTVNLIDSRRGGFGGVGARPAPADSAPLMPSLLQRRLQCYIALILGDMLAILASFAATGYLYLAYYGLHSSLVLAQALLPVFLTVAFYNGAYSMKALVDTSFALTRVALAVLISSTGVVFIAFYLRSSQEFSRLAFTAGSVGALFCVMWVRLQMRALVRWRCGAAVLNELVIDDGGPPVKLAAGFHVSARAFGLEPRLNDPHALDRIGLVLRNADRVIVSTPEDRRAAWAIILRGANVDGEVIDETVGKLFATGARRTAGVGLLQVSVGPLALRDQLTKRGFDLLVAAIGLLVLSPLLLAVALAIKLDDRGPVFFVQRRVGRGNCFFNMIKFRSMSASREGTDGTRSTARQDKRVTRVGRWIRRSSIDELPQLFNVLRGDMSLVGPRPHAIGSQAGEKLFWEVDSRYWQRHALRPGLTGLAQIRGLRGATECEQDLASRLNADLEYLNGWSLWRDLWIIVMTFRVVVHDRAY
ncbi:MAG: sugar transferase [Sphingomonadales bacterium]|nr:sugar transferase [Sphingomonadales bacterium]